MAPTNPLNPWTGDVPVPEDTRELDAALHAGRLSQRIFPYLDLRYGERGRRFTKSDSAWLAWLCRHSQERMDKQILWLRSVLSNRGMPSWILEIHLRVLSKSLVREIPEKREHYAKLSRCAQRLQDDRYRILSKADWEDSAGTFQSALGIPVKWALGTGRLIIAAVVDEQLGIPNAVKSLLHWLADVEVLRRSCPLSRLVSMDQRAVLDSRNFGEIWSRAIDATVAKLQAN